MSKVQRHRPGRPRGRVRAATAALGAALRGAWRALLGRPATPIEVLVVDRARRRSVERSLGARLRRLERLLPPDPPARVVVVVQQTIGDEQPAAGRVDVAKRSGGTRCALVRLALQVDGRRLMTDEILAALCDQWVALGQTAVEPTPVEPRPRPPAETAHLAAFRPDPLVPVANGPAPTAPLHVLDDPHADSA
jgi:hypothetical protein